MRMARRITAIALTILVAACVEAGPASPTTDVGPSPPNGASLIESDADDRREWRAIRERFDDPATLAGVQVGYGQLGQPARIFERELQPLRGDRLRWGAPVADGPVAGQVAVALRDGAVSEVWLIDIETGEERKIVDRTGLITSLELDPEGGRAHLVETTLPFETVDVVSVGLADGVVTEVTAVEVADVARGHVDTHLDTATDRLLVLACGITCELIGVDVADGSIAWSRPSDHRALTGGRPGSVLAWHACGIPCATQLVDPVTGIGEPAAETCGSVAIGVRSGAIAIATDSDGSECPEMDAPPTIHVYADRAATPLASKTVPDDLTLVHNGGDIGYDIDPSAVLVIRSLEDLFDEPSLPRLLDLATGAFVPAN